MPYTAAARAAAFLAETSPDHRNRWLSEVLLWDNEHWDEAHDFIQWMFPNPGKNEMNPDAPILDHADFRSLRDSDAAKAGVLRGWRRMLEFLGLSENRGKVVATDELATRAETWLLFPTHNDLRLTRMLMCLSLFQLTEEARSTSLALCTQVKKHRSYAPEKVMSYWEQAASVRG